MSEPLFYLCPYRFTDDPPAMIKFYETLGLVTTVGMDRHAFAILRGRGGRIGVHLLATSGASEKSTGMCFETPDADRAAEHCEQRGLKASVIDESYGRRVDVADPNGDLFVINEEMKDFYGYREGDPDAKPTIDLMAAWFTDDFDKAAAWYANFDFTSDDHDNQHWRPLRQDNIAAGMVGLHSADDGEAVDTMDVGFETPEPLETVLERLHAGGYQDATITDEGARHIDVTDPDGFRTEIHPSPFAD